MSQWEMTDDFSQQTLLGLDVQGAEVDYSLWSSEWEVGVGVQAKKGGRGEIGWSLEESQGWGLEG